MDVDIPSEVPKCFGSFALHDVNNPGPDNLLWYREKELAEQAYWEWYDAVRREDEATAILASRNPA